MKSLTVPAETDQLETVLSFIHDELKNASCSEEVLFQVNVAVEEIFVNIAHYAYASSKGDATVLCQTGGCPLQVMIEFQDSGIPYNPLSRPDPDLTLSAEERQVGGLGIYMVKQMMDSVSYEYRDGKNILTILKTVA
ncbi:MAG TPA: ATP-binding protein [Candidatus Caccousia avistercoris]|nr:ATP-binding protein [Candidatus Caccousia avistercoris]